MYIEKLSHFSRYLCIIYQHLDLFNMDIVRYSIYIDFLFPEDFFMSVLFLLHLDVNNFFRM